MNTPLTVKKGVDKVYPWSIHDSEGTEIARFNEKAEADEVVALVNQTAHQNHR